MRTLVLLLALAVPSAWAQKGGSVTTQHTANAVALQTSQNTSCLTAQSAARATQNARNFQQMQYRVQNQRCSQCADSPEFSVAAGTYTSPFSVEISDATPGAAIYYTIDGKKPSAASTRYTGPVTIYATTKLRAIAISDGGPSRVISAVYELQ
jgi:hypothetical protein